MLLVPASSSNAKIGFVWALKVYVTIGLSNVYKRVKYYTGYGSFWATKPSKTF